VTIREPGRLDEHTDDLINSDAAEKGLPVFGPLLGSPCPFGEFHPIYELQRIVDVLYLPFVDLEQRTAAVDELLQRMVACYLHRADEYRTLLDEFVNELGFLEHRRKVVATAMAVLDRFDALLPGLAWEHITADPPPDAADYRIVRGDFDELPRPIRRDLRVGLEIPDLHRGDP
jgi:hypothetical protein